MAVSKAMARLKSNSVSIVCVPGQPLCISRADTRSNLGGKTAYVKALFRGLISQVQAAPVFRAALYSRARGPGDARFVDVLPKGRVGFISVVDDQVKTKPPNFTGGNTHFAERDRRLNAIAFRRAPRNQFHRRRCLFNRSLVGIGIASRAHHACGIERENPNLETAHGVLSPGGGIDANLHRIAAPVSFDIIWSDIRDYSVVAHLDVHEKRLAIVADAKTAAAVCFTGHFALDQIRGADAVDA